MAANSKRDVKDLEGELVVVVSAQAACRAKLKRLSALGGESEARRPYTSFEKEGALTMYLMGGWVAAPAVAYLESLGKASPVVTELFENAALERPVEALNALVDQDEAPKKNVYARARSFCTDWRLARWVEVQNDNHSVAPPTSEVLRRRRADTSLSRNRQWCTWWRRKHGVGPSRGGRWLDADREVGACHAAIVAGINFGAAGRSRF